MVDTTDEWILQRTGIRERHIVDPGVATSDLGKEAALKAIAGAGLTPDDIGVIIVGTVTPDMMFPSTACLIQHKIGAPHAWGFDLSAACSAFTYALTTASQFVATRRARARAGRRRRRDVEHHRLQGSRDLRPVRRRRRRGGRLGGRRARRPRFSTSSTRLTAAAGRRCACRPAAACGRRRTRRSTQRLHYVKQDGQTVFKFAVRKTEEIARRCARAQRAHRRRPRPLRVASGEPAHHPVGRPRSSASTRTRSSSISSDSATRRLPRFRWR